MFYRFIKLTLLMSLALSSIVSAQDFRNTVFVDGSRIQLSIHGEGTVSPSQVQAWIEQNAQAVAGYFGSFPVSRLSLQVTFTSGSDLHGRAYGFPNPRITISLGKEASLKTMNEHWILAHEMSHLGFPNAKGHAWIEEGMATYLEPVLRVRAGHIDTKEFWQDMLRGMPQGIVKSGQRGLVYDQTWGRRYWGGALFWFVADLDIRLQTKNRKSIDDVFRAILQANGNIRTVWSLDEIARVGDRATGTGVLKDHMNAFAFKPGRVALSRIWSNLGISRPGNQRNPRRALWNRIRSSLTAPNN